MGNNKRKAVLIAVDLESGANVVIHAIDIYLNFLQQNALPWPKNLY
jgi:hypothetical protein